MIITDKSGTSKSYTYTKVYTADDESEGSDYSCKFISDDGSQIDYSLVEIYEEQDLHEWGYGKDSYYIVAYDGVPTKLPVTVQKNTVESISIYVGEDSEEHSLSCDAENVSNCLDGIIVRKQDGSTETIKYYYSKYNKYYDCETSGYFDNNDNPVDTITICHKDFADSGQWYVYYHGVSCPIKTSHDETSWSLKSKPTCKTTGLYEKVCTCGEVVDTAVISVNENAHKFTNYIYNNDAQVGIDGTETASCDYGCGNTDTRTKAGTALNNNNSNSSASSGGGGGFILPSVSVQKPTVSSGSGYTTTLGKDGSALTITVADDYELSDVIVNGISKGKITSLSNLKTGDKVEIKTVQKSEVSEIDKITAELKKVTKANFKARSAQVRLKNGKKAIKLTWLNTSGVKFDGIEIFRSVKKNSGYGRKSLYTSKTDKYYNTAIKNGTRYYYKVRGYIEVNDVKYYSDWSSKAWRTVK